VHVVRAWHPNGSVQRKIRKAAVTVPIAAFFTGSFNRHSILLTVKSPAQWQIVSSFAPCDAAKASAPNNIACAARGYCPLHQGTAREPRLKMKYFGRICGK